MLDLLRRLTTHPAGYGRIFHVFSDPHPKLELLRRLSASSSSGATSTADTPGPTLESTVTCVPMRNVNAVATGLAAANAGDTLESDTETAAVDETPGSTRWPPMPTVDRTVDQMQGGCDGYDAMPFIAQPAVSRNQRGCVRLQKHISLLHHLTQLLHAPSLCFRLVIAHHQFAPFQTAMGLLPLLAPSRPFVIWCTTLQPLAECAAKLQRESYILNLQLCDTMSRPQQVRLSRTHWIISGRSVVELTPCD
eukprot:COSAG06_NODE_2221_length_7313_cov_6.831577_7_plen_250_part_00